MKLNYHMRSAGLCALIIFLMLTAHTAAQECGEYEVTGTAGFKGGESSIIFKKTRICAQDFSQNGV